MSKSFSTQIRVYYKDTDAGGVVYYSRYAEFMEVARTELLRSAGMTAQELHEEYGILTPVVELNIKYKKSALYDDKVKVKIEIKEVSESLLHLEYEILNQNNELLVTGMTRNCPMDEKSFKLSKFPPEFVELFD